MTIMHDDNRSSKGNEDHLTVTVHVLYALIQDSNAVKDPASFRLDDEDKIVEKLKPELRKLVDAVTGLASTLALATIICTVVYIYRQLKEERRAKEFHSKRMMAER
ncbi:hypothetical protein EDD16DRAFT_1518513 [Pisolithus croceorrhizus]|nr:hypothetical protein F5141DRAFT_1066514 [Pisolithus sp. B1]KAI6109459.1 hypothetical protein EV401DRAFT_1891363 [Pisolithus croceorrhizus]KAI6122194.1 hypothetical protein EDD16DRAFT_1518513 [Pisolithus croceorrhizus]KAI6146928.1 hypothetical protein EDD17DRAFT_1514627 [Pisolithus thermaeus]